MGVVLRGGNEDLVRKATAARNAQLASTSRRVRNIAAIVAHLRSGARPNAVEWESNLSIFASMAQATHHLSQPNGVRDVLAALQKKYPEATVHGGDLLVWRARGRR